VEKGRLKKLILPFILEQLLAVSVGMADTFMVSTVGEAAISGVSLVDGLNLLVIQIVAAFCAGGVVVGYVLITVFHLGILGVWIGMFVDWYGRGISFLIRFISSKWQEKRAV